MFKLGQTIYIGPARLEATFNGYTATGSVKAMRDGTLYTVPPKKVHTSRGAGRPAKWPVGSACVVSLYGDLPIELECEVVSQRPLRARVKPGDGNWQGCVVTERDGRFRAA